MAAKSIHGDGVDNGGSGVHVHSASNMFTVGRVVRPMEILVESECSVMCCVDRAQLCKSSVGLRLICGAPILVEKITENGRAVECTTIPYHSVCFTFFVPIDKVRIHEFITFDPEDGSFIVWDKAQSNQIGRHFSLREAEATLAEYVEAVEAAR